MSVIGIYKITNKITGKYYIGQSGRLENRLSNHKKIAFLPNHKQYNDELYIDIREYGVENFAFEILETINITESEEKWIQKELLSSSNTYNKNLNPHTDYSNYLRKFSDEELFEIINLLKENKLSNIKIAEMFNCSSSTIDNINNGITYIKEDIKYPIRQYALSIGENNPNSLYTDKEIIELRKLYINDSIRSLYEKSDKRMCYHSFERILIGMTYKHLPVYKKRQKCWVLNEKLYRLEP
jgi:group I intron endonuclease